MFISKPSKCKQVELSADFLAAFANFKIFYSTWMILVPFFSPTLSSLKLRCIALSFSHKHVLLLTNSHNITYFVFQSLTQLVTAFNCFCCTIVLGSIESFIMFFSQSLHIETDRALHNS